VTVYGAPNVYAVGDVANISGPDGHHLPQLGSLAQQSGLGVYATLMTGARIDLEDDPVSESALA
jgi:NADH:quinone reductase (non-electrogenic)